MMEGDLKLLPEFFCHKCHSLLVSFNFVGYLKDKSGIQWPLDSSREQRLAQTTQSSCRGKSGTKLICSSSLQRKFLFKEQNISYHIPIVNSWYIFFFGEFSKQWYQMGEIIYTQDYIIACFFTKLYILDIFLHL